MHTKNEISIHIWDIAVAKMCNESEQNWENAPILTRLLSSSPDAHTGHVVKVID